jgi:hypothetical protein
MPMKSVVRVLEVLAQLGGAREPLAQKRRSA